MPARRRRGPWSSTRPEAARYNKEYVPARVLVNTRGRRVRGEYHEWEIHPTKWNRVREPAVYIQTRRTIEPDHYTLIRTSVCP